MGDWPKTGEYMSVGVLQNLTYVIEVVKHTNDKTSDIAHRVAKARVSDVL